MSLRDIKRAIHFMNFFLDLKNLKGSKELRMLQSVVLGLAFVYYYRHSESDSRFFFFFHFSSIFPFFFSQFFLFLN